LTVRDLAVAAALLALLVPSAPARAQARPGSIQIGAGGGRFFGGSFSKGSNEYFDHKVLVDDDVLKGVWLSAQLSRRWGAEVAVRRTSTSLVEPRGGVFPNEPALGTIDVATIEGMLLRYFPRGHFSPYVGFGAGLTNLDPNVPDRAVRDVNRLGISATAGALFFAARWVGFRVDYRVRATYLGVRGLGQDQGIFDTGRWFRDQEFLAGVFFSFGGRH
jgi:hypothetical protein